MSPRRTTCQSTFHQTATPPLDLSPGPEPPFRENLRNSRPLFRADCNLHIVGQPLPAPRASARNIILLARQTPMTNQPTNDPGTNDIRSANILADISPPVEIPVVTTLYRPMTYAISTTPRPKNFFEILAPLTDS